MLASFGIDPSDLPFIRLADAVKPGWNERVRASPATAQFIQDAIDCGQNPRYVFAQTARIFPFDGYLPVRQTLRALTSDVSGEGVGYEGFIVIDAATTVGMEPRENVPEELGHCARNSWENTIVEMGWIGKAYVQQPALTNRLLREMRFGTERTKIAITKHKHRDQSPSIARFKGQMYLDLMLFYSDSDSGLGNLGSVTPDADSGGEAGSAPSDSAQQAEEKKQSKACSICLYSIYMYDATKQMYLRALRASSGTVAPGQHQHPVAGRIPLFPLPPGTLWLQAEPPWHSAGPPCALYIFDGADEGSGVVDEDDEDDKYFTAPSRPQSPQENDDDAF